MMPLGSYNFQSASGLFLAFDVRKIVGLLIGRHLAGLGRFEELLPGEVVQDSFKGGRREDCRGRHWRW